MSITIAKKRISTTLSVPRDNLDELTAELNQTVNWNVEYDGGEAFITFERRGADAAADTAEIVAALIDELGALGNDMQGQIEGTIWVLAIADKLITGAYTVKDITPELDNISFDQLVAWASNPDLQEVLEDTCQLADIDNQAWFAPDYYGQWATAGVPERMHDLVEWLLAVKEGRA